MSRLVKVGMGALAAVAMSAHLSAAADLDPPAPIIEHTPIAVGGGFYLRGDIGYSRWEDPDLTNFNSDNGIDNRFINEDSEDAFLIGGGIGYKFNKHFRTDLTFDIRTNKTITGQAPCGCVADLGVPSSFDNSNQQTSLDIATFFANAYVDVGNFNGFTPYVGGGIGAAYLDYGTYISSNNPTTTNGGGVNAGLFNPTDRETQLFNGDSDFRFAWNLQAGASYEINDNLALDGSYRYTRINNGRVARISEASTVTEESDLVGHEFRLGLRYTFGAAKPHYGGNAVFK